MARRHPDSHWKLGFACALLTAALWGLLPIALTVALRAVDAFTITWFRFLTATITLGAILAAFGRLPDLRKLRRRDGWLLLAALLGLTGNFVLYIGALAFASPTVNQTVSQLSPVLLMLGGILVFHERFSLPRWLGFVLLLVGLVMFFNRRLPQLLHPTGGLGLGVAMLVLASTIWAIYGLSQKVLLARLQAQQVLLLLYGAATILLTPFAHPVRILNVNVVQGWALAFSCANTVVAYGSFAEALRYWEAARVGATIALAPLFTLVGMWIAGQLAPQLIRPDSLNLLSVIGAGVVIGGSMLCAMGNARATAPAGAAVRSGAATSS